MMLWMNPIYHMLALCIGSVHFGGLSFLGDPSTPEASVRNLIRLLKTLWELLIQLLPGSVNPRCQVLPKILGTSTGGSWDEVNSKKADVFLLNEFLYGLIGTVQGVYMGLSTNKHHWGGATITILKR